MSDFRDAISTTRASRWKSIEVLESFTRKLKSAGRRLSSLRSSASRKPAHTILPASEPLFSTFMDSLPGFVWMKDLSGRYVYANQHLKRLTSFQNGWLGKTDAELWPGEIGDTFRENDLKVMVSGETLETVEPCHSDGQDLWVLVNKFPVFDNAGSVAMVGGAGVDITSRKRAEEALREAEEKYRSIFENAVEGIFQTTPEGRFISGNPALARMLGFESPEELISTRTDIAQEHYVDPRSRDEFKCSMEKNGFVLDFELEAYRKDGSKIWISENVRAVRDHEGTVIYYEGTTQDITGRKLAEEALRESEERYRDLVENSRDLICTHDLDGLILSANRAAMELMGYGGQSYPGRTNLREILIPEVRNQLDNYLKRIRTDGVASGVMLVRTRTGEKRIWEYHNTLRTQGVAAPIIRGMARDITEQKRVEEALRESERFRRMIIESEPECVKLVAPDYTLLDMNPAGLEMIEATSREEVVGQSVLNLIAPEFRNAFIGMHQRVCEGEAVVAEFKIVGLKGSHRWMESHAAPMLDKESRVVGHLAITRDITERKQAEDALGASRIYLQALFDNSLDAILVTNDEARYIDANPAACALLGYTREELVELSILDLTAETFRQEGWAMWQQFLARGSQSGEYSTLRKDGTVIQLEFRSVANFLPGIHVSSSRDITERKRAEEAQREAEQKYRDIFENAVEGIFQTSPDGWFLVANPALARMFGFDSTEELIRERAEISKQHYVDPMRRDEFKRLLEEEGIVHHFEYEAYRKDGRRLWVSENVRAVRDQGGTVLCYEGTVTDITQRKRAEEALRESEERYRELFENSKDATYVHDLSGRYTSVNRAAEKLLGYTRSEILGRSFFHFVPPEQIPNISEHLCRKLADEGETSYEAEVIRKDGRRVAIEVNSHLIYENGVAVAVQGVARDITERKAAEEKLKTTSKQLRALSARLQSAREEEGTRIAREIHDELGSVLTSLKWDLEGTDRILAGPMEASQIAALRERLNALTSLTDLAICAIRRIASELRPSVLDDLGLVAAIEWQAQQFQARTGIICECDCALENVELSKEQATEVFRIMQEALTNVLRHAQATRVEIKISREDGHFILAISDDGKGITESEKSEQQSLGILGMRERAHLIDGEINIKGVEGKGTVVIVRVPISARF